MFRSSTAIAASFFRVCATPEPSPRSAPSAEASSALLATRTAHPHSTHCGFTATPASTPSTPSLWANALGIPVLLRAESWLADRPRSLSTLVAKQLFFRLLRSAIAATLPIGSRNRDYWAHYFGADMPQFLMPYAVDNDYFAQRTAAADPNNLRSELQLTPGRPIILFASKLQTRKHADHLIEAYARLWATAPHPLPYLLIVGDGEERARLESRARERALEGVRFPGFRNQSELPAFFALADVFVLPSRHEPWGLIVNEAMAAGCAVIVSDEVGSHADLVTDGVEGFVFPVGDIDALTTASRSSLVSSPEQTQRMRDAGQKPASPPGTSRPTSADSARRLQPSPASSVPEPKAAPSPASGPPLRLVSLPPRANSCE